MNLHPLRFAALTLLIGAIAALGQIQTNPVYTDDSPVAAETLSRVREYTSAGNEAEAIRELQKLLDTQGDRVLLQPGRPDVYISVRQRIHEVLLAEPRLLERYRTAESVTAQDQLDKGDFRAVERSRLLTPAGFEATLRIAQFHLESGHFEAARLVLQQLETHPDRRPQSRQSRDAAEMYAEVARYLDRPAVWGRLDDWFQHAGIQPEAQRQPVRLPPHLQARTVDLMSPAPETPHEHVPTTPLWSTALEPQSMPLEVLESIPSNELAMQDSENVWVLPTVVGDTVYINDGSFITARDRFTLQPRWALQGSGIALTDDPRLDRSELEPWVARREAIRVHSGRLVEDTCTVTVHGRLLVATMGYAEQGGRQGNSATHAVDARTGRLVWSIVLSTLDPQLDGASVRGPAMIEGDTVIVTARKSAPGRRITSLYMVGLSARDGSLKWMRPIASAGAIPWSHTGGRGTLVSLLHEGIVYCSDPLGIIAAVEAATGRPLWIRRAQVPTQTLTSMPESERAWQWRMPIPDGDSIVLLSPDRRELLRLDRHTGELRVRRAASALGSPAYLLKVGSRIAAVGSNQIYLVSLNDLERGTPRTTNRFGVPIQGRVVVAGDKLLVPRSDGIAIIDSAAPREEVGNMRLSRLGNILAVGDQVLVVDSAAIHSYLSWDVAHRLLNERIEAEPDDPHPAITYAELAYRANRHDRIAPAADRALAAIDRITGSDAALAARKRLFNVLRHMVETTQERWAARDAVPSTAPVARPDGAEPEIPITGRGGVARTRAAQGYRPRQLQEFPPLDLGIMVQVVERVGRAARLPDERVSHLLMLGRLREVQSQAAQAGEAYQRILAEPALSQAVWRGPGIAARAELEAARRIRQLVRDHGPSAYAAFEAQAALELDRLGEGAPAEQLEALARRYPAAGLSAQVWARAAERHQAAGRTHASVAALREALASAEHAHMAGVPLQEGALGEIGGSLVIRLEQLEQYFAAAQLIGRLHAQYPGIAITDRGRAVDTERLAADLLRRLAALERLPRIGAEIRGETQAMPGWAIMQARSQNHSRACEHIMMVTSGDQKVALWGLPGSAGVAPQGEELGAAGDGHVAHLQMLWSRTYRGSPPILLRLDPDSAYFFWDRASGAEGPMIERISTVSGETRWRTDDIRAVFPADPALQQRISQSRNTMETPLDGAVRLTDVLISLDEQAIIVAERSGRIAAFDPAGGGLLWAVRSPITRVHDIDAAAGAVVIGGAAAGEEAGGLVPTILVYEPRTGQEVHKLSDLGGQVRWLRIAEGAAGESRTALIAGLQAEIVALDLLTAGKNWSIPGGAAVGSRDAWVLGDRVYVLDEYRLLWMAPLSSGQMRDDHLETFQHLSGQGAIRAWRLGADDALAAFTTERGVCIFDRSGHLRGIDSLIQGGRDSAAILHPVLSDHFFVTVETTSRPHIRSTHQSHYALHMLDSTTAILRSSRPLQLEMPPRRMALLDGRIVITAGNNSFVYHAPELDQ